MLQSFEERHRGDLPDALNGAGNRRVLPPKQAESRPRRRDVSIWVQDLKRSRILPPEVDQLCPTKNLGPPMTFPAFQGKRSLLRAATAASDTRPRSNSRANGRT